MSVSASSAGTSGVGGIGGVREDPAASAASSPPLLFFTSSAIISSVNRFARSRARCRRVRPSVESASKGSIRFLQASLWWACWSRPRWITSQPGHPGVKPRSSVKSALLSWMRRGILVTAGAEGGAGGSLGTGSTLTGAMIPMRDSPGSRAFGCSSLAVVSKILLFHLSEGGRSD